MKNTLLTICLLIFFLPAKGNVVPYPFSQYNFTYLNNDVGLPHNFVDDITKDSQDYIWIATHNGLVRYDGYKFSLFNTETEPITLKSNYIHKITEDNYSRLWIASEGGIDIIDLNKYQKVQLDLKENYVLERMMNSNISSIYKDKKGDIWISSENTLFCLELGNSGEVIDFYTLEENISRRPVLAVYDLGWAVCAGINSSLVRIDKRKNNLLKVTPVSKLVDAYFEDWAIHCMALDGEFLWIGTNRGLFKYDHFNQEIKRYRSSSRFKPGMISQSHITDIKLDENGDLFIATLNGLNLYNRRTDDFSFIQQNSGLTNITLNCNFINCLFQDRNCLWVGTEIGGVNLLTQGRLDTYSWQHNRMDETSLSPNAVNSICEDRDGNLWVGTVEGGLNLKRKGENTFEHFRADSRDSTTLKHNSVSGILLDTENQLWVYTWGGGINKLDLTIPNNKRFTRYNPKPEGVELNFIASACEDTINNGLWFGTTEGLHFYDKVARTFQKVNFNYGDNRFDSMGSLFIDKKNRLWVGTTKGLFIIELFSFARSRKHFDYIHFNHKLSNPENPTLDKVNCIMQDKKDTIWIGTNGEGLYKLISDASGIYQFENYKVKNGLPDNNIIGIVEDQREHLWLSTNLGLSVLDKQNMVFSNYNKYDGLLNNQFYWSAYMYSKNEDLVYFGNTAGLVAINPNITNESFENVRVSLTGLKVLGESIFPQKGGYFEESISRVDALYFHERDKAISIDFSAKKYDYIHQVRYAFRLKGYDAQWTETRTGEHSVTYTSLPPGNYTLQLKATNNKGYWSADTTEVRFYVKPYFYKTWWFVLILILLTMFFLYSFYRRKTEMYRKQKAELEKIVSKRTAELAEQNKRLIEVSRKLANSAEEKITFFTHLVHEFRTPVTLIDGPLVKAIEHTSDPSVKESLRIAERNSKYLLKLVNELMDFRKLDASSVELDKKCENIQSYIEYILLPFVAYAREKKISLNTFYRLKNPNILIDGNYIRKVFINLVSNAIKVTSVGGVINIYVAELHSPQKGSQLYLCVRDTGMGIPEEDIDKIFNQFFQSKKVALSTEMWQNSTGVGLYSCRRIIELHDGVIRARNNQGKGASLRILMPYIECVSTDLDEGIHPLPHSELINPTSIKSSDETILIVDDNFDMRAYIKSLLLTEGYSIIEAQDGAEALSIIQTQKIDLVLSDLMMPVMDGLELSRQVKSHLSVSHIPFIMLTAIASDEQKRISFQIGVDDYLCKPFDEEILLLRIRNTLNARKKYKTQFSTSMNTEDLHINTESKDDLFIKTAFDLMKDNYSNSEYELDSFVRDVGYSKTLVNKKLQALTGQSIGQFMRNYRLNIAREILTNSPNKEDLNISEIAYSVGFNDPKYFTRCFKEFAGVLPSVLLSQK